MGRLAATAGLLVGTAGCGETSARAHGSSGNGGSAPVGASANQAGKAGCDGQAPDCPTAGGTAGESAAAGAGGEAATTTPELHFSLAAPHATVGSIHWGKTVLADLNGDDRVDVAAAGHWLGLFFNDGSRDLPNATLYEVGSVNDASWLEAGDLNGDGLTDLAASYVLDASMVSERATVVLLNQGDGSFSTAQKVADGAVLAIADVNGDDCGDLIVGDGREGETVNVLLNDGTGTVFTLSESFAAESGSGAAAVADVNGDQKPDFVVTTRNYDPVKDPEYAGNIDVFLNQGAGKFQKSPAVPFFKGALAVVLADYNNDGWPDILATESLRVGADTAINLLLNDGHGSFLNRRGMSLGDSGGLAGALFAADFDRDGNMDFGVSGGDGNGGTALRLYRGSGNGSFAATTLVPLPMVLQASSADLDGDGRTDIVASNEDGVLSTLFAYQDGSFPTGFGLTPVAATPSLVLANVMGDVRPEMIVTTRPGDASGVVRVFENQGNGTRGQYLDYTAPAPSQAAPVDLNHDQLLDLAVAGDGVNVLINQGSGFATPVPYGDRLTLGTPEKIAAGDLNGDGEPDLVVLDHPDFADSGATNDGLGVLLNQGDGTFGALVKYPLPLNPRVATGLVLVDLNGDQALDVAAVSMSARGIFLNDGKGKLSPQPVASGSISISAGDVDGDGLADLLLAGLQLAHNQGQGSFGEPTQPLPLLPAPDWPAQVLLHDLNGDGKLDLIGAGGRFVEIALGHGDATFDTPTLYTTPSKDQALGVTAADVNADGKVDVCVQLREGFVVLFNDGT